MSSYTTELRYIVNSEENKDIGLNNYTIFDESYREVLNQKIIAHYYFREICDVFGRFKWYLQARMNEIMPYYNQLYKSELIDIEVLTRINLTEEYDLDKNREYQKDIKDTISSSEDTISDNTGNTSSNTKSKSDSDTKGVQQDTPTGKLDWGEVETGNAYASEVNIGKNNANQSVEGEEKTSLNSEVASKRDSEGNSDESFSSSDFESYINKKLGNNAMRTDSEMLLEYRNTFLNIDMMIINELSDLFMGIY